MSRKIIRPYLVPNSDRFSAVFSMHSKVLGEFDDVVKGWDPQTPTEVAIQLTADVEGALADCRLDAETPLAASVCWRSTRTPLRGVAVTRPVIDGVTDLSAELDPGRIGGQVTVDASVHLATSASGDPLSPQHTGALLWSDSRTWTLEGQGDRFPVEVVDFQAAGMRGPSAAWAVYWYQRDPAAPTSAALRLRMNRRHPIAMRVNSDASDPARSVLRRDVLRALVETACEMPDFVIDPDAWPPGSLGLTLSLLLSATFAGLAIEELNAMRQHDAADFESWIQELTGFLGADGGGE